MAKIRKSTIAKTVARIVELETKSYDIENESEAKYNFVTEKTERQAQQLRDKAEKERSALVARLHALGYCGEYGLSDEEARNPIFSEVVDGLYEIGDGNWC